jgi:hypothetical protein
MTPAEIRARFLTIVDKVRHRCPEACGRRCPTDGCDTRHLCAGCRRRGAPCGRAWGDLRHERALRERAKRQRP